MNGRAPALVLLVLLGLLPALAGCRWRGRTAPPSRPAAAVEPLAPSPRLVLGRLIAVDAAQGFAHLELAADAPAAALAEGTELIARTDDLRETGRLKASRYVRGRIVGATLVQGSPKPGDEVVWLAP